MDSVLSPMVLGIVILRDRVRLLIEPASEFCGVITVLAVYCFVHDLPRDQSRGRTPLLPPSQTLHPTISSRKPPAISSSPISSWQSKWISRVLHHIRPI